MTARPARCAARAATAALLAVPLLVLTALPAAAVSDGEQPDPLGLVPSLLVFLGLPLLILVVTAALVFGPAALRGPRYRPAQGWDHEPVWFAGPRDPESAVQQAEPQQAGRGGASASW